MAAFRKIDLDTVDPQMSASIRKHHFYTLWKEDAEIDAFFKLVNQVRSDCDLPLYTWAKFWEGWQYRIVRHEDYDVAREEIFNLAFGWW